MKPMKKLNEAEWTELATFTYGDRTAWLRGLDTTTGRLYFVEHEDEKQEIKEDFLKFEDLEGAIKAFRKASEKMLRGE